MAGSMNQQVGGWAKAHSPTLIFTAPQREETLRVRTRPIFLPSTRPLLIHALTPAPRLLTRVLPAPAAPSGAASLHTGLQ